MNTFYYDKEYNTFLCVHDTARIELVDALLERLKWERLDEVPNSTNIVNIDDVFTELTTYEIYILTEDDGVFYVLDDLNDRILLIMHGEIKAVYTRTE